MGVRCGWSGVDREQETGVRRAFSLWCPEVRPGLTVTALGVNERHRLAAPGASPRQAAGANYVDLLTPHAL